MKKKSIAIFIVLFSCIAALPQQQKLILIKENRLDRPYYYSQYLLNPEIIDTSLYEIGYDVRFIPDTTTRVRYKDRFILQVGRNLTKFVSETAYGKDSICTQMGLHGRIDMDENRRAWINAAYTLWFEIYSNNKTHALKVRHRIPMSWEEGYVYEEAATDFNWKLTGLDTLILGYRCFAASTRFRGRNWVVWFTSEIPINPSVWKFHSLPGLIMKCEDTAHHYSIECCRVQKKESPIIYYKQKDAVINREKWMRIDRDFYLSPLETSVPMGVKVFFCPSDGSRMSPMTDWSVPYNPIELE